MPLSCVRVVTPVNRLAFSCMLGCLDFDIVMKSKYHLGRLFQKGDKPPEISNNKRTGTWQIKKITLLLELFTLLVNMFAVTVEWVYGGRTFSLFFFLLLLLGFLRQGFSVCVALAVLELNFVD